MKYTFALLFLIGFIASIRAAPVEEDTEVPSAEDPELDPEQDANAGNNQKQFYLSAILFKTLGNPLSSLKVRLKALR